MVKRLTVGLFLLWNNPVLFALQPSLADMGEPFNAKNVQLVWEAPTEKLPKTLNIFNVSPRIFPSEVVSNVVALGDFKEPEKVLAALKPVSQGKFASFQESKPLEGVSISPENGHISYNNSAVIALPRQPVEGVPTKGETLELGLKLLPKFGIYESELARKPDSDQLQLAHILGTQGGFDKQEGKVVTKTNLQGVVFARSVDGVSFNGRGTCGGVLVSFGNHAKIAELQIVWRNLALDRKVSVAGPEQMIQWIKDGKTVIETDGSIAPDQIKKLTITRITPYYLGKDTFEVQKVVYPYAVLTATADTGFTNATVWLSCPIFK